jgi:putative ABC transport system permease protein
MFKVTLKGLLAHKVRLVTTSIAIILGVAFVAGTLVLTATVSKTFNDLFSDIYRNTDAVVRAKQSISSNGPGGGSFKDRPNVPDSLVGTVRAVPGVQAAEGNVSGFAQFVDKQGKAIGNPGMGAPTFGFNWQSVPQLSAYTLVAGQPPGQPGDVVMDKATADKHGFAIGDTVKVTTQSGSSPFTIVGIAKFGESDNSLGATAAFFTTDEAQKLVGKPGEFESIGVVAADGVSQSAVVDAIRPVLPPDTEALTGADYTKEQQDQLASGLAFFSTFLLIFALISLFVGSFIIYNTFSIIVAQRTKELAMLRAIGAGRRQVVRSVLLEALIVGTVASLIGLVVGIAFSGVLKGLLAAFGLDIPSTGTVITPVAMIASFLTGLIVTLASAYFPARRAARVAPVAALRDVAVDRSSTSARRIVIGAVVLVVGTASLLIGLFADLPNRVALVGLGALLMFIGVAILGPILARPVAVVLGWPVEAIKGTTGRLAKENAARNPRRTASTAAALMIGVALVGALLILATSVKSSINDSIDKNFVGDFVLTVPGFGGVGFSPDVEQRVRDVPQLDVVAPIRLGAADVNGTGAFVTAIDPAATAKLVDLGISRGALADLGPGTVAVTDKTADTNNWKIGDTIPTTFAKTGSQTLRLVATYANGLFPGEYLVSLPTFEQNFDDQLDYAIYTKLKPGASAADAQAALDKIAADYPIVSVDNIQDYKQAQTGPIDQIFGLMYVLLTLAIIIALFGIANTLALSIHERTRELGLLRAVGMSRAQLRSSVRWESAIIALFGTALGAAIGTFFGWSFVRALGSQGVTSFSLPLVPLVAVAVLATLAGVGFALRPAWRASKLDVLGAIASE